MGTLRFIIFMLLCCIGLNAQKRDSAFCDCDRARKVVLKGSVTVGPTLPPANSGKVEEISQRRNNTPFAFAKEHHSAWYRLEMGTSGLLVFDLVPLSPADDYDFMLFKAAAGRFCDSLRQYRVKPIRACISRKREELKGVTGLNGSYHRLLVNEGPGDSFVAPVEVMPGDVYYLVVDNVYDNGDGHSLRFAFEEHVVSKGRVTDAQGRGLVAEVSVTGPLGDTLHYVKTGKDGSFNIDAHLRKNVNYNLTIFSDNTFFYSRLFSTRIKDSLQSLEVVMKELQLDASYAVGNINFEPGIDRYLRSALPAMNNLKKLMLKNPTLQIMIIGHTNGCYDDVIASQKLSVRRAEAIRKYLVKEKIDGKRISTAGKGCSEMLYPISGTEAQQSANRRVEIHVTGK